MRRADCEIKDHNAIIQIIRKCQVCRLGLTKDSVPYIVPVSFAYADNALYFHTALAGMKVDFIEEQNRACFEFELDVKPLIQGDIACDWGFSFQSVIGHGVISELTGYRDKADGLKRIIQQYVEGEWPMTDRQIAGTRVWKLEIESMTGKQSEDHFCS